MDLRGIGPLTLPCHGSVLPVYHEPLRANYNIFKINFFNKMYKFNNNGFFGNLNPKKNNNIYNKICFGKPFDFGKIKQGALHFAAIFSDNDPHVDLKFADIFKEKLGAESQILHHMGHFSGSLENEAACLELPGAAEAILKMSGENS